MQRIYFLNRFIPCCLQNIFHQKTSGPPHTLPEHVEDDPHRILSLIFAIEYGKQRVHIETDVSFS